METAAPALQTELLGFPLSASQCLIEVPSTLVKLPRLDFHSVSEIKSILQIAFSAKQRTSVEHMKWEKSWRQHVGWSLCGSQHPAT